MTKFALILAGLAAATVSVPAAAATQISISFGSQPYYAAQGQWQSINQRQVNIDRRIDRGIRTGQINRNEAQRLRVQFRQLNQLEYQYRRSGGRLTVAERRDLDRRFDRLSQRVYNQTNDRQTAYRR